MKTFKSDNTASVHPQIMAKLTEVNTGHADPYGYDPICLEAEKAVRGLFDTDCHVSFVLNGTGANVIGLSVLLKQFEAVICADTAHINVDECGAFERYTGAKLLTVPHQSGKITIDAIQHHLQVIGNEHHSQPRVISISQLTEWGTAYTLEEIRQLADYAHSNGMLLHVDGARIANAAVYLGVGFKEMITDTGVDLLSFGGAKNGMMYGEAIVSFCDSINQDLKFSRKQGMQLMSKMRYIAAQYIALIDNDLWHWNAFNANERMAQLYEGTRSVEELEFMAVPEGNMLFVTMPLTWIDALLISHHFYRMTEEGNMGMVRLVTSFDTTEAEVKALVDDINSLAVRAQLT